MRCARCHRPMKRDPVWIAGEAFGPRCAAVLIGAKAKPADHVEDPRQPDLFDTSIRARIARAWDQAMGYFFGWPSV